MSPFQENVSVCDSDNSSESVDYNDMSPDEKANASAEKKLLEKGKYTIRKCVPLPRRDNDGSQRTFIKNIVIFSSRTTPRSSIRDPRYGTFSSHKVGSKDEYNYFKVRMPDIPTDDRTPITLYYDSPEGYEKHQYTTVSDEIKNAWHTRRTEYAGYSIPRFSVSKMIEIR